EPRFLGALVIRGARAGGEVNAAGQRLVDAVHGIERRDFEMSVAGIGECTRDRVDEAFGTALVAAHDQRRTRSLVPRFVVARGMFGGGRSGGKGNEEAERSSEQAQRTC